MNKNKFINYGSKLPRAAVFIGVVIIILLASVALVRQVYSANLKPVSQSQRARLVEVPAGASAKQIAASLEEAGVIRAAWAFEWYVRNNGLLDKLQAGTYYLRPNQSGQEIAAELSQGAIAADLVTILPARRLDQIKSGLINQGFDEATVAAALDPNNYQDHPALVDKPRGASLEGYLYPESFHKVATTSPESIVRQSLDELQKRLTPDLRAAIVSRGMTVHDGIKLASIIEQEVSDPNDKQIVAQVFHRRLGEGLKLQSDPTAVYGALQAGLKLPSDPAQAAALAIAHESHHNTYKHAGLPPTPISNISLSSLQAVAYPAKTNYLFFVAGDDEKTHFSKTLEEHEDKVRRYCKELCSPS